MRQNPLTLIGGTGFPYIANIMSDYQSLEIWCPYNLTEVFCEWKTKLYKVHELFKNLSARSARATFHILLYGKKYGTATVVLCKFPFPSSHCDLSKTISATGDISICLYKNVLTPFFPSSVRQFTFILTVCMHTSMSNLRLLLSVLFTLSATSPIQYGPTVMVRHKTQENQKIS